MNRRSRLGPAVCILALCALPGAARASSVSFQPLGDLPGGGFTSLALGISADGSTVVGWSESADGNMEAFRWTSGQGMVPLGSLTEGEDSAAWGVSADGAVVVGRSGSGPGFIWTEAAGMVRLSDQTGSMSAWAISADGLTVVGHGLLVPSFETGVVRWTATGGFELIGSLPPNTSSTIPFGVSADGTVIVGQGPAETGTTEAFRWTSTEGMVRLGGLIPASPFISSGALAVSADGAVVVGVSLSTSGYQAFRWTSQDGMVGLGDLPGGDFSSGAWAVSADGSVIAGRSDTGSNTLLGTEAFYWTSTGGMQNLRELLIARGATGLDGWILENVRGISSDGRTLAGIGQNPDGHTEAWIATVPEPSTDVLAAMALVGLSFCWVRRAGALVVARRRRR